MSVKAITSTMETPIVLIDDNVEKYMSQLTPLELKAHNIAKQHLKSSFNVLKSNGYVEWLKKQPKKSA